MNIYRAKNCPEDLDTLERVVQGTIQTTYPQYYPKGAVDFFISHHSREKLEDAILHQSIYFLEDEGQVRGVGTIKDNEILRLFVLPEFQGKGYGQALMDCMEKEIFAKHDCAVLDAALSSCNFYRKRGYEMKDFIAFEEDNGDYLCFFQMEKKKP